MGYDLDGILAYGVLGFSSIKAAEDIDGEDTATGFNFGVGAAYQVAESFTVGAEYLIRRTEFDDGLELAHDTFSIRGSFSF